MLFANGTAANIAFHSRRVKKNKNAKTCLVRPCVFASCVPRMGTNHDLSEAKNAFRTRRVKNPTRAHPTQPLSAPQGT